MGWQALQRFLIFNFLWDFFLDNLHPTRRINVPEGFHLMTSGEPDSKFSPGIEEVDKLKKSGKLSLVLVLGLALSLGLAASVWAQPTEKGMGPGP